jgi:hypothetical protein
VDSPMAASSAHSVQYQRARIPNAPRRPAKYTALRRLLSTALQGPDSSPRTSTRRRRRSGFPRSLISPSNGAPRTDGRRGGRFYTSGKRRLARVLRIARRGPARESRRFRGKGSVTGARACCGKVDGASAQLAPHDGETVHPGVHCSDRKCGTRPAVAEREERVVFMWAAQGGKGEVGRGAGEKSAQPPIYSFFQFSIFCFPISFLFQISIIQIKFKFQTELQIQK